MNKTETRLRGVIKGTFHGTRYRERVKAGETVAHDCGFIKVPGHAKDYFVNVTQIKNEDRSLFKQDAEVEFTPFDTDRGPKALKVVIFG